MATLAFDAVSEIGTAGTDFIGSWTHTPVGTPKGIFVLINYANGNDRITAVTYGGVAMTQVRHDRKTSGSQKSSAIFFLGSGIPTGPQTVSVTGTSDTGTSLAYSYVADGDTAVVDNDGGNGTGTNVSALLDNGGFNTISVGCVSHANTATFTPSADQTLTASAGMFNGSYRQVRQDTAAVSSFTAGGTLSVSKDYAFSVANIRDTAPIPEGSGNQVLVF